MNANRVSQKHGEVAINLVIEILLNARGLFRQNKAMKSFPINRGEGLQVFVN